MPLDGLSLRYLAHELQHELVEGRIDKITHPKPNDVYFHIRSRGQTRRLVISIDAASARAHLTKNDPANPFKASGFLMFMRKHFSGGRIQNIYTVNDERVLIIEVSKRNEMGDFETKKIYAELMGRYSNLVVVNQKGIILEALKHIDEHMNRVRQILPGQAYVPPPAQDKQLIEDFVELSVKQEGALRHQDFSQKHRAVHRIVMDEILGVSPLLAKELCFRADLNPAEQASRLTAADWSKLDEVIVEFSTAVANGQGQPGLLSEDPEGNKLLDFHAYPIYSAPFFIKQGSLSEAMDHYYHDKLTKAGLEEKRQSLMRKIQNEYSGIKKLIAIHKEDIESTKDRDKDKEKGEFILANLHLAEPRAKELTGVDYYDPEMKEKTVELDPRFSAADNAKRYFKRYERAGSRKEEAEKRLVQEEKDQLWLESLMTQLEDAETKSEVTELKEEFLESFRGKKKHSKHKNKKQKQAQRSKPRQFTSTDGFTILVGRNSRQNDRLTHHQAEPEDIWLHRHLAAGTHVIIQTHGKDVPAQTLEEAAGLCAWYSQTREARQISHDRLEIAYCYAKDVKRMPGGKPGLVIYENFKTMLAEPLNPKDLPSAEEAAPFQD